MKVIIAGSRNFTDYSLAKEKIDYLRFAGLRIDEVVSGQARGADQVGERYAHVHGLPVKTFKAHWDHYGRRAGHVRNRAMADYAGALIAFWDGTSPGTKNMIELATERGLEVHVIRTDEVIDLFSKL